MSKKIEFGAGYERKKEWKEEVKKLRVDGMSKQMEQSEERLAGAR